MTAYRYEYARNPLGTRASSAPHSDQVGTLIEEIYVEVEPGNGNPLGANLVPQTRARLAVWNKGGSQCFDHDLAMTLGRARSTLRADYASRQLVSRHRSSRPGSSPHLAKAVR